MSDYEFDIGGSVSRPMSNKDIGDFLKGGISNTQAKNTNFSSEARTTFDKSGVLKEDSVLIDQISALYASAMDSVGLNFVDPLEAYSTNFNKNMQTLGLDPQRPGNSYVFFTRPDLNISPVNIQQLPFFNYIMKTKIGNLVANYLQYPDALSRGSGVKLEDKFKTDSVFDPLMTNTCKELSGLKDMSMDKYETEGDFSGHQLTYASGADGYDTIGEVSATFEDSFGSPIFLKHFLWFQYIHEVCKGTINPRMNYIRERIIDYTCSIYTFKLAEDNQTILRFAKLTGCYPLNVPMNTLNHSRESKADEFDDITISYAFNMYEPMNPKIIADFNKLTMPTAFIDNSKIDDVGKKGSKFVLKDPKYPEKLLDGYDSPSRFGSLWARTPIVVGNKLLFV